MGLKSLLPRFAALVAFTLAACSGVDPGTVSNKAPASAAVSAKTTRPESPFTPNGTVSEQFLTVDDKPVDMLRMVPDEFLVKFRKSTSVRTAKSTLALVAATSKRAYRSVPGLHRVKLATGGSSAAVMALARTSPEVEYVQPNYLLHISGIPDDTQFTAQWALNNTGQTGGTIDADIDAPEAWDITTGSDSVVVAVVDTGVRYIHPDLVANAWRNEAECTANGIDDDGNGYIDDCHGIDTANGDSDPIDDNNHGTHVAGIIGATGNNAQGISGVARNVKILACKALDFGGSGSTADIITCLDYIADMKSRGVNIVATNNSYGGFFPDQASYDAIEAQQQAGILFVAAAGNTGWDGDQMTPEYPCGFYLQNIICVTNSDHNDVRVILGSHSATRVHIAAPGTAILSTVINDDYQTFSGTSMATPHVVGTLVLLKAQDPNRDWRALRNLVLAGSDLKPATASTVTDSRLNAHKALTCNNSVRKGRLRPTKRDDLIVAVGDSFLVSMLNINCAAPNGNLSVGISPGGGSITLLDDGAGDDQVAGDGVYSARWVANAAGTYTFAFPETVVDNVTVVVDPHLKRGFPGFAFNSSGQYFGGPGNQILIGNVDDDPEPEIFASALASGPVYAWNHDGTLLDGWPDFREGGAAYSTLGEYDGDTSRLEVHSSYFGNRNHGVLSHGNGDRFPGWPILDDGRYASAAADLDGDGVDEVIAGNIFRTDTTLMPLEGFNWDSPGIADLDGDEVPEIISASNTSISVHTSRGEMVPGWPYGDPSVVGTSSQQTVSMGDIDGDGNTEMVFLSRGNTNPPWLASLSIFANDGHLKRSVMLSHTFSYLTPPVLADLDGDGIPEIVAQMDDAVYAFDGDGSVLPGWPVPLPPTSMRNYSPVVGDIDGNPGPEIVVLATAPVLNTGAEGILHVYSAQGVELFTKFLPQLWSGMNPAIADIDLDGRNDLVLAMTGGVGVSRDIWAYTFASGPTGPIEWGQYREGTKHHSYYPLGKNLPTVAFLAVHADGNGRVTSNNSGIDCGTDCIQRYTKGANVTLTATPPPGGVFRGWRGACTGTATTCVVNVARNRSVIADFTTRELTVAFIGQGAGRLVSSPAGIDCGACTVGFPPNTYVTLTPVPDDASYFYEWLLTGDCTGNAPTCTVKMDRARSATAIFSQKSVLTVELIGAGHGRVVSSPAGIDCTGPRCTARYIPDTFVALTPTPADIRSEFRGWSNSCNSYVGTSCVLRVVGDTSAFAIFQPRPGLGVTKSGTGTGTVTSSPAGIDCGISCWAPFPQSSQVTLTATPAADSSVGAWSGACAGSGTTCVTSASELASVDVTFTIKPLITVNKDGTGAGTVTSTPAGIDCGADCNERYVMNTNVTLTAAPAVGSDFTGWSGGCGAALTCSFAADSAQTRTATFTLQRHALTVSLGGTGSGSVSSAPAGINCGADCTEDYLHDTVVTLTAAAASGNTFAGWSGACAGAATTCSVTMSQVQTVTASFRVNQSSSSSSGGGGGGGGSLDWMMLTLGTALLLRRRYLKKGDRFICLRYRTRN